MGTGNGSATGGFGCHDRCLGPPSEVSESGERRGEHGGDEVGDARRLQGGDEPDAVDQDAPSSPPIGVSAMLAALIRATTRPLTASGARSRMTALRMGLTNPAPNLANAIFEYLEIWHNRKRRHSQLGWLTPLECERNRIITVA